MDTGSKSFGEPLELNRKLFDRLNELGVRYCHWKSNDRLAEALSGGTDIDILVDRTDFLLFLEEITCLGFKLAAPRGGEPVVSATHYYGLDRASGQLVTLHLPEVDLALEVYEADWESAGAVVVDGSKSPELVLDAVQEQLWRNV